MIVVSMNRFQMWSHIMCIVIYLSAKIAQLSSLLINLAFIELTTKYIIDIWERRY